MTEVFAAYEYQSHYMGRRREGYRVPFRAYDGRIVDMLYPIAYAETKAKEKRFSDAELAAEFWRVNGNYDEVAEGYRIDYFPGHERTEEQLKEDWDTFLRFAEYPHYDEESDL